MKLRFVVIHNKQGKDSACMEKLFFVFENRDFDVFSGLHSSDAKECSTECQHYEFFGLQNNGQCFCGHDYSTEEQYEKILHQDCGKCPSENCKGGSCQWLGGDRHDDRSAAMRASPQQWLQAHRAQQI